MIEIYPFVQLDDEVAEKTGFLKKEDYTFYMVASERDCVLGVGKMKVYDNFAEICDVLVFEDGFDMLLHGIGKAMLNFIERREIYDVICKNEKLEQLMRLLRFKKENEIKIDGLEEKDIYYVNLDGYFNAKCEN